MTEVLASGQVQVRVGLHTGTPLLAEEGYVGHDVHFAARIAATSHGGQVVFSHATAELVDISLTDLGEHRLKDIEGPVPIFQLGSKPFPPLKTISNTNLPRPASSFVGRDKEVEEIVSLLLNGARLLTLTGPGGSGKTRLAIEAAMGLVSEFKAGVFWVGLAALREASLVAYTIGQTLGAKDGLVDHIQERELLLLLDNVEQVVEAAPELASLVEACPNLKLLVTSRELLRVRGEVEYPVLPLAEPEAVELFCARARAEPDETVRDLCRALDNLPLALELAAARTALFSPKQLLERLSQRLDLLKGGRDADPRQQTLRATIEWSYELLSEADQALFARLSVFSGGCTYEAAEEVAWADPDTLQSLLDKSLLRKRETMLEPRYWMLETIREYASKKLEAAEADEVRQRQAAYFLDLAEEAYPHLTGSPKQWLDRLEAEHDNLRAALDHFGATGDTQFALQLAGALWKFWNMRGHVAEGSRRLESVLLSDTLSTPARARALNGATAMLLRAGDSATARDPAERALALQKELGDRWGIANSVLLLGNVEAQDEHFEAARELFEDALHRFEDLGDEHYVLLATRLIAWMCYELGDRDRARALHEDVVRHARAVGNQRMEATSLGALSEYALNDGRVDEAIPMLTESTRIYRDLGERLEFAINLCRFARAVVLRGRPETAAVLLGASDALIADAGASFEYWVADMNDVTTALVRDALDEGVFAKAWEKGRQLSADEAVALALETPQ
jgi:predicted ATPase